MESVLRKIAVAATIGMFLVLLMGATVTTTGSAEGCGDHWPLCNGRLVPSYTIESAIEYSHRLVTGIEGILIMITAIGALITRPRRWDIRLLVALMVGSLFLQAGMGAWAVKATQSASVLALHFGFSLICFATTYLTMMAIREGNTASPVLPSVAPPRFGILAWASIVVVYGVAYLGAYIRRVEAEFACGLDWPLCNGRLVRSEGGDVAVQFGHRAAAFGSVLFVFALVYWASRFRQQRPDIFQGTLVAAGLILAQSAVGGVVILSKLSIWAILSHAGLMALLFVVLCDIARRTITWSYATGERRAGAPSAPVPFPAGD